MLGQIQISKTMLQMSSAQTKSETDGKAIKPCPVIGMVGIIDDWRNAGTIALPAK